MQGGDANEPRRSLLHGCWCVVRSIARERGGKLRTPLRRFYFFLFFLRFMTRNLVLMVVLVWMEVRIKIQVKIKSGRHVASLGEPSGLRL